MSKFRISFVQATVNPNSVNAALALAEEGILSEVITTIAYDSRCGYSQLLNLLPAKFNRLINSELNRRSWWPLENSRIRTHIGRELVRLALLRFGLNQTIGIKNRTIIDWVYVGLDRHVKTSHLRGIDALYAYEDEAAESFEIAKSRGIRCIYDLPSIFYPTRKRLEREEAEYFPELAHLLQSTQEPAWKLERKALEVELADHIIVASSLNERALIQAGVPITKISVIPYGAPIEYFVPIPKPDKQFRALFIGGLSPHKGAHYLLQAWQELKFYHAELLCIGNNRLPQGWLRPFTDSFRHINTVPHASLNEYYCAGNVLVFPSLMDGFGLVLLEAMACGIPVITTCNTGGPDIVTDGVEGFIIPIRDVEALKEKLVWCYENPDELAEMGRAARRRAEQFTWSAYRKTLVTKILDHFNSSADCY